LCGIFWCVFEVFGGKAGVWGQLHLLPERRTAPALNTSVKCRTNSRHSCYHSIISAYQIWSDWLDVRLTATVTVATVPCDLTGWFYLCLASVSNRCCRAGFHRQSVAVAVAAAARWQCTAPHDYLLLTGRRASHWCFVRSVSISSWTCHLCAVHSTTDILLRRRAVRFLLVKPV